MLHDKDDNTTSKGILWVFKQYGRIIKLLAFRHKIVLIIITGVATVSKVLDLLSIMLFAPFLALLSNPSMVDGSGRLAFLYNYSGITDKKDFIFYAGVFVLCVFITSKVIAFLNALWTRRKLDINLRKYVLINVYKKILSMDPHVIASVDKGLFMHKSINQVGSLVNNIAKIPQEITFVMTTIIFIFALVYSGSSVILVIYTIIIGVYYFLFKIIKNHVHKIVSQLERVGVQVNRIIIRIIDAFPIMKIANREAYFLEQFRKRIVIQYDGQARLTLFNTLPSLIFEILFFSSILGYILFIIATTADIFSVSNLLTQAAVIFFGSIRIFPLLRSLFARVVSLKRDEVILETTGQLVIDALREQPSFERANILPFQRKCEIRNVFFKYDGSKENTLENVSIDIFQNHSVAIVGKSGSGKSTLLKLISGLLLPHKGTLMTDDVSITKDNIDKWQCNISYVPQRPFVDFSSVFENITFGDDENKIDMDKFNKIIEISELSEDVQRFPEGVHSIVGESGSMVSGGQAQRISIARALYWKANILVFDEATSSLDRITEKKIINNILREFQDQKTFVIVTHRLSTIKHCDIIYFMEDGKIVDEGTYDELIARNNTFRQMADAEVKEEEEVKN